MVQMKFFAILLCIAIGSVFGELQRRKFEKEKLEVTEDANEARSLISLDDGRKTYSSDESVRVKYALDNSFDQIAANTKDADSVEKETPRNPSSVIDTSTVKPTSSKSIKKNLEIKYLGRPATHFKMLHKTVKPEDNRSEGERKTLNDFFKSFLRGMDALNLKETNLARKERRALRRKRDTEHPPTKVEDPTNIVESLEAYRKLRDKLPVSLRQQVQETDKLEEKLLKHYAATLGDWASDYSTPWYESQKKEREILYNLTNNHMTEDEAWELINNFRALRKGNKPLWNFIGLRPSFQKFLKSGVKSMHYYIWYKLLEYKNIDLSKIFGVETEKLQDSSDRDESRANYKKMLTIGTETLRSKLEATDEVEWNMLSLCVSTGQIQKSLLDAYYKARKNEFQQFKEELARYVLRSKKFKEGYRHLRNGSPWWFLKEMFEGLLNREGCGQQYTAIKKEEQYTDQYLDGSMKIGEVPKKDENAKAEAFEKASSQTKSEKANRKLRAEVAQVARAEEDEKAEEMERGVRAKETETVEAEYDDYREHIENIFATSDDVKEDVEVHGSPDNVTSADVRNTENTTDKKTKENSHLLRFAILFAMVMQLIIAILILAPQRDKLVEWCKRKKRTESDPSETEPLQAGEKVFPTGPTSKVLKVSSQRRPDVADANQRARV